jgi:SNF2 family DNA or RNA helicase
VDEFTASPISQVLLLSTRVGGLGLNLSAANVCIVFDPNWNPSHEYAFRLIALLVG